MSSSAPALLGMALGSVTGVVGAYVSLTGGVSLSSGQFWAAAFAGASAGLLLGLVAACFMARCTPDKMFKAINAIFGKAAYLGVWAYIRFTWGPCAGSVKRSRGPWRANLSLQPHAARSGSFSTCHAGCTHLMSLHHAGSAGGVVATSPSRARSSWACTRTAWGTSSRPCGSSARWPRRASWWTRWRLAICRRCRSTSSTR